MGNEFSTAPLQATAAVLPWLELAVPAHAFIVLQENTNVLDWRAADNIFCTAALSRHPCAVCSVRKLYMHKLVRYAWLHGNAMRPGIAFLPRLHRLHLSSKC